MLFSAAAELDLTNNLINTKWQAAITGSPSESLSWLISRFNQRHAAEKESLKCLETRTTLFATAPFRTSWGAEPHIIHLFLYKNSHGY